LSVTYDGGSHASGLKIYVNGRSTECDVVRDKLTRDITHRAEWGDADVNGVQLALGARFRDVGFKGGATDEFAVYSRELTPLEAANPGALGLALPSSSTSSSAIAARSRSGARSALEPALPSGCRSQPDDALAKN